MAKVQTDFHEKQDSFIHSWGSIIPGEYVDHPNAGRDRQHGASFFLKKGAAV